MTRLLIVLAAAIPLAAQTAVLTGAVVDNTGAGVPDLKVTLTNQATHVEKEIRTGADGAYSLKADPGRYAVGFEKPGRGVFALRDVELAGDQTRTLNFEISAQVENRNFRYMFYGFVAAWLVLVIYVISLVARERGLRKQIDDLKRMVESERT